MTGKSTVKPHPSHLRRTLAVVALAVSLGGLAACGSGSDSGGVESPDEAPVATDSGSDPGLDSGSDDGEGADPGAGGEVLVDDDPVAGAPALVPSASFAIENSDQVSSVGMSPDGAQIAVVTQPGLGEPVTITLYDSKSGEVVNSTQADAIGLSLVQWMADNRLVFYADREVEQVWRSWDAATLEEQPAVPLDPTCYAGKADRDTGVVYSSDGLTGMGDDLCRVDTADGSVIRTGAGVLIDPNKFWLVPGSGGVVVEHYPDPNGPSELVTLEGTALTAQSAVELTPGDTVRAVGLTMWMSPYDGPDQLEPGGIPVPPGLSPVASDARTVFVSSNADVVVFVSAVDGSVIGTMPAELNPSFTSDWSIDDSSYVRLTLDGQAEIYQF